MTKHLIENVIEKTFIETIRKRQKIIHGLKQDEHNYLAVLGTRNLSPGCEKYCLKGKWVQIRTTSRCNLNCNFCYYHGMDHFPEKELFPPDMYYINGNLFSLRDVYFLFETQGHTFIEGVAWLHGEPLMDIDKILPVMSFLKDKGYYQWLYTNGTLANTENLHKLKDAGLDEIRFNLAASNCSKPVLKNLETARGLFNYVCIESPMYHSFSKSLITNFDEILDTGVNQFNLAELQLFKNTIGNFENEGPIYRYKFGYVSPLISRHLIYDIMEYSLKYQSYDFVIHDCSNEVKYYRGFFSNPKYFGDINYKGNLDLDDSFYTNALSTYPELMGYTKSIF